MINPTAPTHKVGLDTALSPKDFSGTITVGNTAQVLIPANALRRAWSIQNTSSGDLWFNEITTATTASPSFKLTSGALYESPVGVTVQTQISVIGATTSQSFTAREYV